MKFTRFDEVSTMIKRIKRYRKAKSKSKSVTPVHAGRFRLFGQPQVLEGEDPAAYNELLARICDAINPADTIEEIFIADVVSSEWEVLRWTRLKVSLIREPALKELETFLVNSSSRITPFTPELFEAISQKFCKITCQKTRRICGDAGGRMCPGYR